MTHPTLASTLSIVETPINDDCCAAYDRASLALNEIGSAVRILIDSSPDEHTTKVGLDIRGFLLASILANVEKGNSDLEGLSPYASRG